MKRLLGAIHSNFKKVRIRRKPLMKKPIQLKLDERRKVKLELAKSLPSYERHCLEDRLAEIEVSIIKECSLMHRDKVLTHVEQITDHRGQINTTNVWKLRKRVCPKPAEQISAKKDQNGNRVTNPERIKDIYLQA